MWKQIAAFAGATCLVGIASAKAQTSVCVEVEVRSWAELGSELREAPEEARAPETEVTDDETLDREPIDREPHPAESAGTEVPGHDVPMQVRGVPAHGNAVPAPGNVGGAEHPDGETNWSDEQEGVAPERIVALPPRPPAPHRTEPERPRFEPPLYLRRLIEYQITHMPGFEAVREGCTQRMVVQFYPLQEGWTMFARYDGTSREEKVDRVRLDEFPALAARLTEALLHDRPLEETLSRRTVLRSDSEEEMRRVRGRTQTRLSIGTELIMGLLPTARSLDAPAENKFRVSAPLAVEAGARTTYRAWALDGYLGMLVGTARQSVSGAGLGHADYTFGMTAALHFMRYVSPDAAASLYGGGGASFQIHRYRILPGPMGGDDRGLVGGGLNLDLVLGYEVMRASALSFFVEVQALLPAYGFDSENRNGAIRAWLPTAVLQIGLLR